MAPDVADELRSSLLPVVRERCPIRLSTLALLLIATPYCVPIDRGATRTTLVTEGGLAASEQRREVTGCNGEELAYYEQGHQQIGGSVTVSHEARDGLILAGSVAGVRGRVTRTDTSTSDVPEVEEYGIVSAVGEFGHDWANTGVTLGLGGTFSTTGGALPRITTELRLGYLAAAWLELGTRFGAPLDGRTAYAGLGLIGGPLRVHVGAAILHDPVVDAWEEDLDLAHNQDACCGAYLDLELYFAERWGMVLGGAWPGGQRLHTGLLHSW